MCAVRMQIKKIVQEVQARGAESKEHKACASHQPWIELNLVSEKERKKNKDIFRPMMPTQCPGPGLQRGPLHGKNLFYAGHRRGEAGQLFVSNYVSCLRGSPYRQI